MKNWLVMAAPAYLDRDVRYLTIGRLLAVVGLAGARALAQMHELPGDTAQVPLPAATHYAPAPALSAEEERRTFQLPPGFHADLLAPQTAVQDPVAAAFDLDGNLWVCEMQGYNFTFPVDVPELAAGIKHPPRGHIVKLESTHHDGFYDKKTDWMDDLVLARGIAVVHDGLLVLDPPNLWLCRDLHHTGHCDDKQLLANNFGLAGSEEESGSLLWGRDNLLHGIAFPFDLNYRGGAIASRVPVPARGQFGITQDDFGRFFFSLNSDQLRGDFFSPTYAMRNPAQVQARPPWVDAEVALSQETWPAGPTPMVNRGYRRGELGKSTGGLRDNGSLLEFTAACSALDYRGTDFPSRFYGNVFVPDPSANLIKRDILLEAEGKIVAANAYDGREFMTSTDQRFRPVALLNAPDGSMIVVDMYRGVLEGSMFITLYLHHQIEKRDVAQPMYGLGRLWRIHYGDGAVSAPREMPQLSAASSADLAQDLAKPDGWWRDTAQQEIVERGDRSAAPALEQLAGSGGSEATRVAALWTLDGLGATRLEVAGRALRDPSPKVRAVAVRLHEKWLNGPDAAAARESLRAVMNDPAPEVLVQLALTLGEDKSTQSLGMTADLMLTSGDHPFMPSAVLSGVTGRETALLAALLPRLAPNEHRPEFKVLFAGLAGSMGAADLAAIAKSDNADLRAAAGAALDVIAQKQAAVEARAKLAVPLTPEQVALKNQGATTFLICAACHQPTGQGLAHVAPSLVDSPWVAEDPAIMVRIVLDGKEGTPGFASTMPPIGAALNDEQIAGVITYVRNSFGLHYGAASPDLVARVRKAVAGRGAAWTDAELTVVKGDIKREKLLGKPVQ